MPGQRIFISYSRKDYYFAESLTFHLLAANLPAWLDVKDLTPGADWEDQLHEALETASCFVLVLSRNALRSPNVRAEWERAIQLGKPILVAQFRGAQLPDELRRARISDFRSGFQRGLREFVAQLQSEANGQPSRRVRIAPNVPPWVAVMTALMSIPMLVFCALGFFRGDLQTIPLAGGVAILFAMVLFFAWILPVGFLRRRMGMTRLAVSLACLSALYGYQLARIYLKGPSASAGDQFGFLEFFRDNQLLTVLLCGMPLAGLVSLVLVRPEDLLRWCPTGKVWHWYRARFARRASAGVVSAAATFKQLPAFHLFCDAADQPAASRLRGELIGAGAREATNDPGATPVLLLSNRTTRAWLNTQADRLNHSVFTIVVTGIALPASLDWLWRREWVDFRTWQITTGRAKGLPAVPEAVTHIRLPSAVLRTHQILCAFGALLFTLGASALPDKVPDTPTPQECVAIFCAVLGTLYGWTGRRLIRRRIGSERFSRWVGAFGAAGIVLGLLSLYASITIAHTWFNIVIATAGLLAAPALMIRMKPQIAFWFPIAKAPGQPEECLTPNRDWLTLLSFVLYLFIWIGLLQKFNS